MPYKKFVTISMNYPCLGLLERTSRMSRDRDISRHVMAPQFEDFLAVRIMNDSLAAYVGMLIYSVWY